MEMKSMENLHPYALPEKTMNKFNISQVSYDGINCCILTGGDEPEKRQILYLHMELI
jgi:hypothetical protein